MPLTDRCSCCVGPENTPRSPVFKFVYLLLTKVSGVPMLEKPEGADDSDKWGNDPAYKKYKASTPPVLFPSLFGRAHKD